MRIPIFGKRRNRRVVITYLTDSGWVSASADFHKLHVGIEAAAIDRIARPVAPRTNVRVTLSQAAQRALEARANRPRRSDTTGAYEVVRQPLDKFLRVLRNAPEIDFGPRPVSGGRSVIAYSGDLAAGYGTPLTVVI